MTQNHSPRGKPSHAIITPHSNDHCKIENRQNLHLRTDYRCESWYEPTIFDVNALSFKIHVSNPQKHPETKPEFLSPLLPILKNSKPTLTVPVTVTSTPINAENILCIGDKSIWSRQSKKDMLDTSSRPPLPQTVPAAETTDSNEDTTQCLPSVPQDLNVIKAFIQHDKDDDYIPLMSAIALKKKKRVLFLPVEFNNIKVSGFRCVP